MKILALMPSPYGGMGGIAQYNRDLFNAMASLPGVSTVVSFPRGCHDQDMPLPAKVSEKLLPGHYAWYVAQVLWRGLEFRPDLILCGHIHLLPVAALLRKLTHSRVVLEIYGIEAWQPDATMIPRIAGHRSVRRWALASVDRVIAISRYTRERFMSWSGCRVETIDLIPNAIHLDRYSIDGKPPYLVTRYGLEGKRVLLTLGSLDYQYKGQDRIIAALPSLVARFSDLVYLVAGDGVLRAQLEAMTAASGLGERVIFAGRIAEEEKLDHYHLADAFAMPSTGEGFGFVFLEAVASGLPVLGGNRDGTRDALLDGKLGLMVDPDNETDLLDGLERLLTRGKSVPPDIRQFDYSHFMARVARLLSRNQSAAFCAYARA